jgi:hypothetical protein
VRKAVLAAVVAAAALVGVVVAVVLSSRGDGPAAAPPEPPTSPTAPERRHGFLVGTVDDALVQPSAQLTQSLVDVSRGAGFNAAVVSATWTPGLRAPLPSTVQALGNVAKATKRAHMELIVFVWNGLGQDTPRGPSQRADFAAYAAALVRALPQVGGVIVGNEPNLSTFWSPQFGAGGRDVAAIAYEDLLARTYDAIKGAKSSILVMGGAVSPRGADRPAGMRPTHSPTAFIRDLGAAYRASGRAEPIMDAFAIHPYMQASKDSPETPHPDNTTITIADYSKLVGLLGEAFSGTHQLGKTLPVYYTEFGVQTPVPPDKQASYTDLDSPAAGDAVSFEQQAAYYRRALELAYCQPTVRGLFVFHTFDEASLGGWQSGLYFADRTPKPSLAAFKRAVSDLRDGNFPACGGG